MKLASLHIRNFQCFGPEGVEVAIDNIVVIIGPNNVGKSAVLNAYEAFASTGAKQPLQRFHNEDANNPIEMIGTFIDITTSDTDKIGTKWTHTDPTHGECVKVKYEWAKPDADGVKSSWDDNEKKWQTGGMGGFDSLFSSCIPAPIRITPREDPAATEAKIVEILTAAAKSRLKADSSKAAAIIQQLEALTSEFNEEVKEELDSTCELVGKRLNSVFPSYSVEFVPAAGKFEPEKSVGTGSHMRFRRGTDTAYRLDQQGTGLQRTFLWAALGALAEQGKLKVNAKTTLSTERPKVLLIDEPEAFLHPPLVRAAREVLYEVASVEGWQVIATTHSSIFVDVSKPHTSIVRLERSSSSQGSKLFSTEKASFDGKEKDVLRMVRSCHPTVAEFFFADHVILVEGETEHLVLNELLSRIDASVAQGFHVLNCMGKGNLPLFARILNQFALPYTIIHDSDQPRVWKDAKWQRNGMWTVNAKISTVTKEHPQQDKCRTLVHIPDFEGFYFGTRLRADKPYFAAKELAREDFETSPELERLRGLLRSLITGEHEGLYSSMEELTEMVRAYAAAGISDPEAWELDDAPVVVPVEQVA